MQKYNNQFNPDTRNLGGKREIDQRSRNHLLALINIKPSVSTHKPPHKHVNQSHKSQKQQINHRFDFKEVHEAYRRVTQMKKGGIDNKAPATMSRQNKIKNRIPQSKNIQMQDHQRNIKSLLLRLDDVEKSHQKNVTKIKNIDPGYTGNNTTMNRSIRSAKSTKQMPVFSRFQKENPILNNFMEDQQQYNYNKDHSQSQQKQDYQNSDQNDIPENYQFLHDIYTLNSQSQTPRQDTNSLAMDFTEAHYYDNEDKINEQQYIQQQKQYNNNNNMQEEQKSFHTIKTYSVKELSNYSQRPLQPQQKNKLSRPGSANPMHQQQKNNQNKYNIPFVQQTQSNDPYRELRRVLLNIVMDQNLYDKRIITQDLPIHAKKANPHLLKNKIQEICQDICLNLYGSLEN